MDEKFTDFFDDEDREMAPGRCARLYNKSLTVLVISAISGCVTGYLSAIVSFSFLSTAFGVLAGISGGIFLAAIATALILRCVAPTRPVQSYGPRHDHDWSF